jgi:hypothetical protein
MSVHTKSSVRGLFINSTVLFIFCPAATAGTLTVSHKTARVSRADEQYARLRYNLIYLQLPLANQLYLRYNGFTVIGNGKECMFS